MPLAKEIWNFTIEIFKNNKTFSLISSLSAILFCFIFFSDFANQWDQYGLLNKIDVTWIKVVLVSSLGFFYAAVVLVFGSFLHSKFQSLKSKSIKRQIFESNQRDLKEEMMLRWSQLREKEKEWTLNVATNDKKTIIPQNLDIYPAKNIVISLRQWGYLVTYSDVGNGREAVYLVPLFKEVVLEASKEK